MRNVVLIGSIVFYCIFNQKNPQLLTYPTITYERSRRLFSTSLDEHLGELEVSHSFPTYRSFQLCANILSFCEATISGMVISGNAEIMSVESCIAHSSKAFEAVKL
jgi:hypothetical protein